MNELPVWGSNEGEIDGPDRAENQEVAEAELEPKHQSLNVRARDPGDSEFRSKSRKDNLY